MASTWAVKMIIKIIFIVFTKFSYFSDIPNVTSTYFNILINICILKKMKNSNIFMIFIELSPNAHWKETLLTKIGIIDKKS